MDITFGFVGDGFALVVCDTYASAHGLLSLRQNYDKILPLDSHKMLGLSGEFGDFTNFSELIQANMQLYKFRNDYSLSTKAVAHFMRGELATALRKGPYMVNLVLAGYDEATGPSLYYLDYLACLHKMNCAGHGYGFTFTCSIFDKYWKPGLKLEEAMDIVDKCIAEIRSRLVVAPQSYIVKIVDKDGIRTVAEKYSAEIDNTS
mmetsp:Transcript_23313/g.79330  ORF Transcript_23313/g.79330 Transcript_23313/m.79330 type:complete len:204 (+) Transcript_23313:230-841(+)